LFDSIKYINQYHQMANIGIALRELMHDDKLDQFIKLIEQNPSYNLDQTDNYDTLLHRAIELAKLEFVRALVSHGANIHFNDHGDALRRAAYWCAVYHSYNNNEQLLKKMEEYQKIIMYLLESGANCNTIGVNGDSSLTVICRWSHPAESKIIMKQIVMLLLDHGADRNFVRSDGHTAEREARDHLNDDIADCIRDYQPVMTKGCYGDCV